MFASASEQETERLGRALGQVLNPGLVVALVGELGAGKTRLVQSVAAAMGVDRRDVNSPTFVLVHEYEGRMPIYHFDAYRLRDSDEFAELGADEMMAAAGVCFIEWADRVDDVLPSQLLRIEIEITAPTSRMYQFAATGQPAVDVLARLRRALDA